MQALSHSAFLQALGYAIINSLWQMALLWIVVVLLNSIVSLSSNTRYKIALSAQFTGFTWFIVTLQYYFTRCAQAIYEIKEFALSNPTEFVRPEANNFNTRLWATMIKTEQLLPYLSLAYILLLLFLVAKWIRGYRQTQLIRSQGLQKIDVDWKLFVQRMSDYLGIEKKIKIFASTVVKSPMTIGFLKPVILIPVASLNHLSVPQLEAVILHELAHIKRADYLINLVQCIIEIALFFNPFSQLISRFIKKEREHSCDDWVLQFQYNPTMYAEALLQLAYLNVNPTFAMNATGHSKGDLLSRVRRMLNKKEKTFTYKHQLFAFLLMTFILTSIAWFDPNSSNNKQADTTKPPVPTVQPEVPEPVMANADNPFFNPVSFLNTDLKEEIKKVSETVKEQTADITTKSISAANEALTTVVPAALNSVKNLDLSSLKGIPESDKIQTELNKAYAEIKKINFSTLIDTLAINTSIRNEFAKANWNLSSQKVDLQKLNAQISKLSFLDFVPANEREKIKQSITDALKQAKDFDFNFEMKDSPEPVVPVPPAPVAAPAPVQAIKVKVLPSTVTLNRQAKVTLRGTSANRRKGLVIKLDGKSANTTHGNGVISSGDGNTISFTTDDDDDNSGNKNTEEQAEDKSGNTAEPQAPQTPDELSEDNDNVSASISGAVKSGAPYVYQNRYNAHAADYIASAYNTYKAPATVTYNFNTNAVYNKLTGFDAQSLTNTEKQKLFRLLQYLKMVKHYSITQKQICTTNGKKDVVLEIEVYQ